MACFADLFLQVDGSPNTEQGNSPVVPEQDKANDIGREAEGSDLEKPKETGSAEKSQSGLPATANQDCDGDVTMSDGFCGNTLSSTPTSLDEHSPAAIPAPANATPASTSGVADDSSTNHDSPPLAATSNEPPLPIIPVPASSARSPTPALLPSDEGAPAFLTQAILARLRGVSPATSWQNLITAFLQFEKASPPSGVRF
jgi:hypothetical protein